MKHLILCTTAVQAESSALLGTAAAQWHGGNLSDVKSIKIVSLWLGKPKMVLSTKKQTKQMFEGRHSGSTKMHQKSSPPLYGALRPVLLPMPTMPMPMPTMMLLEQQVVAVSLCHSIRWILSSSNSFQSANQRDAVTRSESKPSFAWPISTAAVATPHVGRLWRPLSPLGLPLMPPLLGGMGAEAK